MNDDQTSNELNYPTVGALGAGADSRVMCQLDLPLMVGSEATLNCFTSGPFIGLPRGHFTCAHIDLPWAFKTWSERGQGKGASQHYRVSSLDSLAALPVPELMAWDSALFLWVTQPLLPQALQVLARWQYIYKTVGFVWIKMPKRWTEADGYVRPRMGLGFHYPFRQ